MVVIAKKEKASQVSGFLEVALYIIIIQTIIVSFNVVGYIQTETKEFLEQKLENLQ